ncbi:hypothetical protein CHU98_g7944 [Xylaria longipes]|nr:hypothetical protein CHU98_g7944 [Xylaria longipes]
MDRIIYTGCWVVLILYILTTLIAFTQRSSIAYAASFLSACILFLDLSLFNTYFFLPAFRYHIREVDIRGENAIGVLRAIFCSEAAWDVYLIILGSFGSWLAVFNAAKMLKTEGCAITTLHGHGRVARYFIKSVDRLSDYLGFGDNSAATLPTTATTNVDSEEKSLSGVFADTCWDEWSTPYHLQTTGEENLTKQAVSFRSGRCWSPEFPQKIDIHEPTDYADAEYRTQLALFKQRYCCKD